MRRVCCCTLLMLSLPSSFAATIDANPTNYRTKLATLVPGDTLVLASGTYAEGLPIGALSGTAQQPIVIRGPEDQSAIFTARSCCNTVQLDGASHVEVRSLTLDGLNLDGPFGVDARGATHHITVENLRIINFGADQQDVGISTKGTAWNWIIRRNTIIGAGTGIYLGNSDGTQPFVAGLIENNLIVDTIGYNLQIKHQLPRPTNLGLPAGTSRTIIRNNVFSKRNDASTGSLARPNVLVGHFPLSGAGADDSYEIYGNFFHDNPTEALFQGEGNIALYGNLLVNSAGDAVNVQPQNDRPRNVAIAQNTVVANGSGIRVTGGATGTVQRIVGNAVFAASPISGPNATDNITGTRADAVDHLVAPLAAIGSLSLFPKPGSLSGSTIDLGAFGAFTEFDRDFDGQVRSGSRRGAYEGEGSNPGWTLALALKPVAATGGGTNPAPTVTLSANPSQVPLQGRSTLTWSSTNATACQVSGGWSGARVANGSEAVGPLAATTAYRLDCSGPGGSQSASTQVVVVPAPTVSLTASAARVTSGGTVSLQWSSSNASSCTASGAWSGSRPGSGTETSAALTAASSFTLACTGVGGNASQSVVVVVAVDAAASGTPPSDSTSSSTPTTPSTSSTSPPGTSAGEDSGGGGATSPLLAIWLAVMLAGETWARGRPERLRASGESRRSTRFQEWASA